MANKLSLKFLEKNFLLNKYVLSLNHKFYATSLLLLAIFKKVSYDELKGHLQTWLEGGDGEGEPMAATTNSAPAATTNTQGTGDINTAFDSLFNS